MGCTKGTSLQSLTDELLLLVIDESQCYQDLDSLSQSCRQIHRLCGMATRKKYWLNRLQKGTDGRPALEMLLSVLKVSNHRTYVRELEVTISGGKPMLSTEVSLQPRDRERLKQAIRNANFDKTAKWRKFCLYYYKTSALSERALSSPQFSSSYSPEHKPLSRLLDRKGRSALQTLAGLLVFVSPRLKPLGFPVTSGENLHWILESQGLGHGFILEIFLKRACARSCDIPCMRDCKH